MPFPIQTYHAFLTIAQQNYTTTKKDLLTFEESRNILMGQRLDMYTDHKILTDKVFNTEGVMQSRLISKQYGADIQYIKGSHNIIADLTLWLTLEPDDRVLDQLLTRKCHEACLFKERPENAYCPMRELA